nr:hypothetical protein [Helicobacter pylori]
MRQEKASVSLKKTRKRCENKKERSITLTRKTELKTPTREPKKSVLEPELKPIFNP